MYLTSQDFIFKVFVLGNCSGFDHAKKESSNPAQYVLKPSCINMSNNMV